MIVTCKTHFECDDWIRFERGYGRAADDSEAAMAPCKLRGHSRSATISSRSFASQAEKELLLRSAKPCYRW